MNENKKFCGNCGAQINVQITVCPKCGKNPYGLNSDIQNFSANKKENNNNPKIALIMALAIIVIFGGWYLKKHFDTENRIEVTQQINSSFAIDKLNKVADIKYDTPVGEIKSFKIDLLGTGKAQRVKIAKVAERNNYGPSAQKYEADVQSVIPNFDTYPSLLAVTVTDADGKELSKITINGHGKNDFYVAYLRDDNVPDLIFFSIEGRGHFANFCILGKSTKSKFDILVKPEDVAELGAWKTVSLSGKNLILNDNGDKKIVIRSIKENKNRFEISN